MTVTDTITPSAGWFPDPRDASAIRWWDGQAWTDYSQPLTAVVSTGSASGIATSATAASSATAGVAVRTLEDVDDGLEITSSGYSAEELARYTGKVARTAAAKPAGEFVWNTAARGSSRPAVTFGLVFVLLWPLIAVALFMARATLTQSGILPDSATVVTTVATAAACLLLQFGFAASDRHALVSLDLERPASARWGFIPLAYPVARTLRLRGQSLRAGAAIPVSAALLVVAGVLPSLLGLNGMLGATFTGGSAANQQLVASALESRLQQQLAAAGHSFVSVDCPATEITVSPNSSFRCAATAADRSSTVVMITVDAKAQLTASLGVTTPTPRN